jgi:transcriptional regulator with XRE-family HTH domain
MSSRREHARVAQPLNISLRIAARVRELRLEQGLTLDALAAQCEFSRSMLSLIERGESSATAVVLERIAVGLDVPLASLFDNPAAPENPLSRYEDQVPWQDPASGYIRRNVSPAIRSSPFKIVPSNLTGQVDLSAKAGGLPCNAGQWSYLILQSV